MKKVKQTQKSGWPAGHKIKSIIMQYVDVNALPPTEIKAFLEDFNEPMQGVIDQLKAQNIAVITIPVRPGSSTRFEVMQVDDSEPTPSVTTDAFYWNNDCDCVLDEHSNSCEPPVKPKALGLAEKLLKEAEVSKAKTKSIKPIQEFSSCVTDGFDNLEGVQVLYCDDGGM